MIRPIHPIPLHSELQYKAPQANNMLYFQQLMTQAAEMRFLTSGHGQFCTQTIWHQDVGDGTI